MKKNQKRALLCLIAGLFVFIAFSGFKNSGTTPVKFKPTGYYIQTVLTDLGAHPFYGLPYHSYRVTFYLRDATTNALVNAVNNIAINGYMNLISGGVATNVPGGATIVAGTSSIYFDATSEPTPTGGIKSVSPATQNGLPITY